MIEKYKNVIISALIILIIISIAIILIIFNIKDNNTEQNNQENDEGYSSYQEDKSIEYSEKDISKTTLNILLNCINKQDKEYVFINEVYVQRNDSIYVYAIYGKQNNNPVYYIASLDYDNYTYNIKEVTAQECDDIKYGKINDYIKVTSIEKVDDNTFELNVMLDAQMANFYYDIIKNLLNSEPEVLYDMLNIEYKQKKFETIDNYLKYVNTNKTKYANMEISKYAKYKYDGYTQYVCLDNNGDYYIINDNVDTGEYEILLDTYTVDQPEFIEKYEAATDDKKAGYDINKFITAINAKDYNYAYNCLATSFKQNKFPTLESFEKYIKNNFYEKNEVQYTNGRKEGNYYMYTLNITDANNSGESIQKDFIVNLKDDREFEMSFGVE